MSRVSENSSFHAINHSVGKTKSKLEDLQVKGSNLKRIQKPSDDPMGNTELLAIRSKNIDAKQYLRNINLAKAQLQFAENAIEDLTEIVSKAKEIAIGQSSNLFDEDIRQNVSKEVEQLRKQSIAIANRRFGSKYIFAGHKTLTRPFDADGKFNGDNQQTRLEVSKDLFVPINYSGQAVFINHAKNDAVPKIEIEESPLEDYEFNSQQSIDAIEFGRTPASTNNTESVDPTLGQTSLFSNLATLHAALETNNHMIVQDLLPELDKDLNRLIQVRTKMGSVLNTIDNAENNIEKEKLMMAEYGTKIEDADVAELYTDLSRQQNVLNASYKASAQLMNSSLLNFIK